MTDRERKVRGERIRASRAEKRERRRRRDDRELGGVTREAGSVGDGADGGAGPRQESVARVGDEPFVETPAVTRVVARVRRWLGVGRPVHLVGPTGCGKTALAAHVAAERDRPVVWIDGDADLTTADLVGEYGEREHLAERDRFVHNVLKRRTVVRDRWVDNPLTVAVREGATLVYNEFSRSEPAANNVLLSVFAEGVLELPGRRGDDRTVPVHPEFRALLTSNAVEYAGVHRPQDALLDRLVGVHLDWYDRETETEIVTANVDCPRRAAAAAVSLTRALRDRLDVAVGTRTAVLLAEGATAGSLDETLLERLCVDALASKVPDDEALTRVADEVRATLAETDVSPADFAPGGDAA